MDTYWKHLGLQLIADGAAIEAVTRNIFILIQQLVAL